MFLLLRLNTVIKKQVGEKSVYYTYTSISQFTFQGSQGRKLEAGAKAEAMDERHLLAFSKWLANLAYRTQDQQLRDGSTNNGLGPLSPTTNSENSLQAVYSPVYSPSHGGIFLIEVPSPEMTFARVKLT